MLTTLLPPTDGTALVGGYDVRKDVGLLEVLRREEDGHSRLPSHQRDLVPDVGAALRIETRGRLVQEENARAMHEREREVEPPLHAPRVAGDLAVGGVHETDAMEKLLRARATLLLRHALQRRLQAEVVARGEERVERGLLQRDADEPADLWPVLDDVVPGNERRPRRRRQEGGQDVDRGGLPGAVRAEEAVDLAGRDRDVDPVDGARAFLVLANEPADLDPVVCQFVSHLTVRRLPKRYYRAVRPSGTPIGLQLAHSAKHVGRAFNDALAEVGGSMPTWFILTNLKGEEWRTQHELARALHIEGPTLTRHIDGLEEEGLVVRRRDTNDRRAVSVELTDAGRAKHTELLRAVQAFNQRLLAGFSAEELDELQALLGKLEQNARAVSEPRA